LPFFTSAGCAISMAGSSVIVALNVVALKRLRLPETRGEE
jgi:hypothetical protein